MTVFLTALIAVAVLLLAAVPGYALIKFRAEGKLFECRRFFPDSGWK